MVRKLSTCENIGSATVICTDKTDHVLGLIHQGVGLNTTGMVFFSGTIPEYSDSLTEKAILSWAVVDMDMDMDMEKLKQSSIVLHKRFVEMVLEMCTSYYERDGCVKVIDDDTRIQLENIIKGMTTSSLRCIAFAHKQVHSERLAKEGLTLLRIVGLKDPCRPGAKKGIDTCWSVGVGVRMITRDNIFTAKAIATECGILEPGLEVCEGEVVEGVEFRNYTDEERMLKVDTICVMSRSSPFDKLLMVQCLKGKGHMVAVTGDGTNDASTLKEADIGLLTGIQGTKVAK
nr:calcium-transporting ATPase 12, plasma membrane-type-like [Tanacetum cinerariifolium]